MKILINYADAPWKSSQHLSTKKAHQFGNFDRVIEYGPESLDSELIQNNPGAFVLNNKRAGKFGIWRPYIVMNTIEDSNDGDLIVYLDSGAYFVKSVDYMLSFMKDKEMDILLFNDKHSEEQYTKQDIFEYFHVVDSSIRQSSQRWSGCFAFIVSPETRKFFAQWLVVVKNAPYLFTDQPNQLGEPNSEEFIDTRHNQSVLSVQSKVAGYAAYRDPSQWGYDRGIVKRLRSMRASSQSYPELILLHRSKNFTQIRRFELWVQQWFPRLFDFVLGFKGH